MVLLDCSHSDVLDCRVVVEVGADESTVERSAKERGRCRMDAEEAASLLNVASEISQALVVEHGAGEGRILVGSADEADGLELGEKGEIVKAGLVFGVDGDPAHIRDGRIDGGTREGERAISERGYGANCDGNRFVSEPGGLGVKQDARRCCCLRSDSTGECCQSKEK